MYDYISIYEQVLLNMLLHGMDPQAALDAPRLLIEPAPSVHALNTPKASHRCARLSAQQTRQGYPLVSPHLPIALSLSINLSRFLSLSFFII